MMTPDESAKYREVMDAVLTRRVLSAMTQLATVAEVALREMATQSGAKEMDFVIAEMDEQALTPDERMHTLLMTWANVKCIAAEENPVAGIE